MMRTSSRKAKGRRLQNWVRDTLLSIFTTLDNKDISCAIMGETGEDIKLSNPAKKLIPYSFECKNKETFKGIYDIINQAQSNAKASDVPIAVIKMNKFKPLVIVDDTHFFNLIGKQNER